MCGEADARVLHAAVAAHPHRGHSLESLRLQQRALLVASQVQPPAVPAPTNARADDGPSRALQPAASAAVLQHATSGSVDDARQCRLLLLLHVYGGSSQHVGQATQQALEDSARLLAQWLGD